MQIITARNIPDKAPTATPAGPLNATWMMFPWLKAMACATPKPVIASTSSRLAAAITRVGIPAAMPHPAISRRSMFGTTTAGETAARTKLFGIDKDVFKRHSNQNGAK